MKLQLHEIELGSQDLTSGKSFYQDLLGLDLSVDQEHLKVFNPGLGKVDFNLSTHFPPQTIAISFLCDDLQEMMTRLQAGHISFEGPSKSHLGMICVTFKDPNGYIIKINEATEASPL
jgi:predicted enzyme related to lactoylglutathione lyase